ncbi:MAG: ribosomal protein S18-alanine N-acetyltransferase [Desulfobacteraceae bacterium]|nr:ribosomal protein S18-alanine N-acetyltransferase [Desulfobacteraceae bacterium]
MPGVSLAIRPVSEADLPGLWAIEETLTGPWTRGQLEEELCLPRGWGWRAVGEDGQTQGYLFGLSVLDEAEIRKLAVAARHRWQGVATRLLAFVFAQLASDGVRRCFLELRAANAPALSLYQKSGFVIAGRRKSYYTRPVDDAILLEKLLIASPPLANF